MLTHIYIRNYALFAETEISFPAGLNILTGETGAGKSLLVGALGLIMGRRADNSVIFYTEEKCVVEAEFSHLSEEVKERLAEQDEFDLEDELLTIRREIRPNGKSRAFINDTPVSLSTLRHTSAFLVDLHGQHENQTLLSADKQLSLLDTYAGTLGMVKGFEACWKGYQDIKKERDGLLKQEQEAKEQQEYFQFQLQELTAANLKEGEEEELEQELNLLQHAEEIRGALAGGVMQLYEEDQSVYQQLSTLLEPLQKVSGVHQQVNEEVQKLLEAQNTIKETSFQLQHMLDTMDSEEGRMTEIEERLATYHNLKLKYKLASGDELLEKLQEFQAKVVAFESIEERVAELTAKLSEQEKIIIQKGLALEEKRLAAKPQLEDMVENILKEVGFTKARFDIAFQRIEKAEGGLMIEGAHIHPDKTGLNTCTFMIQSNPGVPPGPLSEIASGGEISRVMLAIKATLAEKSDFPVMIFDEIDTGISGEIAQKVGKVMRDLSERFQILSITHLPQIAAKGHQHYKIYKEVKDTITISSVRMLNHDERIGEVAMMLSGHEPSESAIRNAEELISAG
ncbi:MAG: DNA repair protein RecN [Bacteroidota bacterium]